MKKQLLKKTLLFLILLLVVAPGLLISSSTVTAGAFRKSAPTVEINHKIIENAGVREFFGEYYFSMELIRDVLKINLDYNLKADRIQIDWQGIQADVSCQKKEELTENPGGFPVSENGTIFLSESFLRDVLKIDLTYSEEENLFTLAFTEEPKTGDSNLKTEDAYVACLTFDDGIDPERTNEVLDVLKEKNVKASFFVIGKTISWNKETVERIVKEGHLIGNHSFSHNASFLYENQTNLDTELKETDSAFEKILGWAPKYFRPPYGITYIRDKGIGEYLNGRYQIVLWNVDSRDAIEKGITADKVVKNIKLGVYGKKHAVILMHCTKANKSTVEALPEVIDWLRASGYVLKTIAE